MKVNIKEIQAKSVLIPTKLPGADWVVNPYVGCTFGCKYCYATFMGRWKHPGEEWGSFLDVKVNAPEILQAQLGKLEKKRAKKDFGAIFFSSVTDPYLGQETKYQITRQCLQILVDFGYQGEVSILTKSPLVTRDIDLFKQLNCSVGLTITTSKDKVARFLEGSAPLVSLRLKALTYLNQESIQTYAFIGPVLPHFTAKFKELDRLSDQVNKTGTRQVWVEHLYLTPLVKNRIFKYLKKESPLLISEFKKSETLEYRNELERVIMRALKGKNLKLETGKILFHQTLTHAN